jgi:hypothetical protein
LDESQPFFWEFTPEVDSELLRQLCEALRTIALPAMQAFCSREALLAFHEQRPAGAPYTLPIVLALLGRREEARADVARRLEAARSGPPMWLAQYRPFAERFERWLDTGVIEEP